MLDMRSLITWSYMKAPLYNNCISGIKPIETKKGVVKISQYTVTGSVF